MPEKFKFKIENDTYEWDSQFITGSEIRSIPPGIPENMDLFLKIKGKAGRLVGNDEEIDLSDPGIEKFYTQEADSDAGN